MIAETTSELDQVGSILLFLADNGFADRISIDREAI